MLLNVKEELREIEILNLIDGAMSPVKRPAVPSMAAPPVEKATPKASSAAKSSNKPSAGSRLSVACAKPATLV